MSLDPIELKRMPIVELVDAARDLHIDNAGNLRRQDLIFEILRAQADGSPMLGSGVLEILPDGFGFLRSPDFSYQPGPDDVYVSPSQIRRFNLRTGDTVEGQIRAPKEGEKYFALIRIERVNERSPDRERDKLLFSNLTARHPSRRMPLESESVRFLDFVAPLAFGQRVALHAPLRSGRTTMLVELANALEPECAVLMVVIDERPEDVTELKESVRAVVLSSTIDEAPARHVQVAEMALEHAKRLSEQGQDVVLLFDGLNALLRSYHATAAPGGRLLQGIVDAGAVHKTRRFLATGRDLEQAGSLTLIASVLRDTGSAVDALLTEELAAMTNADIVLDPDLAREGLFPAIHAASSQTHRLEHILDEDGLDQHREFRARLSGQPHADHAWIHAGLEQTATNAELLERVQSLDKPAAVGQ